MKRPAVSVVMATHNQAATLSEALKSLKAQKLPAAEAEVIVVNDGSTDETARILRRHQGWIRLIETEHRGLVSSCNEGLAAARGRYFTRIDSDDLADPYWLLELSHLLEQDPGACCVIPDRYELHGTARRRVNVDPSNLYSLTACGTLFRTESVRKAGGFRPFYWEEYDLYLRLKTLGPFLHWPEPLYLYRKHPGGMTHNESERKDGWRELAQAWGSEALRAAGSHPELEFAHGS